MRKGKETKGKDKVHKVKSHQWVIFQQFVEQSFPQQNDTLIEIDEMITYFIPRLGLIF